jgi:hypothetical protein
LPSSTAQRKGDDNDYRRQQLSCDRLGSLQAARAVELTINRHILLVADEVIE